MGMPVSMADAKSDAAGLSAAGNSHSKIDERVETIGKDDEAAIWGVSLSGKWAIGRDDLRWMTHHGDGRSATAGLIGALSDRARLADAQSTTDQSMSGSASKAGLASR